jgi:hypothetical protein
MNSKTIFISFAVILLEFLSVVSIFALSLEDLIGPEQIAVLTAQEKTVLVQFDNPRPRLIPRHEVLRSLIETVRRDLDPNTMVGTLYLYEKPPAARRTSWNAEEEAGLYNGVLALSTLAGIQYFSASRGIMRTLYETSQIIDGPSTKRPLPDPVYSRPPAKLTVYTRQKDLTFGDNIYQYDFYAASRAIIFIQQNLTSLTAGIIPAVGKNNLHSAIAILDAGNYLLIYAVSMAKARSLPGMKERIGDSFSNRAEAILYWFSAQADKVFNAVHESFKDGS